MGRERGAMGGSEQRMCVDCLREERGIVRSRVGTWPARGSHFRLPSSAELASGGVGGRVTVPRKVWAMR